jgi:hypothetical protein
MLHTILLNLADHYPQAPASGGTPRMREAIVDIRRVEEEENDHIFSNASRYRILLMDRNRRRVDKEKITLYLLCQRGLN